jgi:SAM-dependent methyltransferase
VSLEPFAARLYEDVLVPAMLRPWARKLLDAAAIGGGERVLDVACGTGVLTRGARARGARAHGLDVEAAMLAVAREVEPGVAWCRGSATALPYPDASFDVVTCQFGLMFVPDRGGALDEMVRVTRPGGRVAIAVWDALESVPAQAAERNALRRLCGHEAAAAFEAPFQLGDRSALRALLEAAGTDVQIETAQAPVRFTSARALVEFDLGAWLPFMDTSLPTAGREQVIRELTAALGPWTQGDGRLAYDSSAHVAVAVRQA